jgi:glutathione S-transferase
MAGGWAALRIMEDHLGQNEYYVGDYFIAEIALFAYMHVAREGDFPLDALPKVREWIERVKTQPSFFYDIAS